MLRTRLRTELGRIRTYHDGAQPIACVAGDEGKQGGAVACPPSQHLTVRNAGQLKPAQRSRMLNRVTVDTLLKCVTAVFGAGVAAVTGDWKEF
jgi:hypothetical protein